MPAALSLVAMEFAATVPCGCSHRNTAAVPDASVATAPDAGARGARSRRRRRGRNGSHAPVAVAAGNGGASPSATATTLGDPGRARGDDLALGASDDDEPGSDPVPRVRPRMTETGPMLSETLGRPGNTTLDLTRGAGGTMGLEPAQISNGMNPLLGRLARCADATGDDHGGGAHGRVSIRLRIRSSGAPVAAQVSGGGGSGEFVTCVRRVVASAHFASFAGPDVFATWGFDVD